MRAFFTRPSRSAPGGVRTHISLDENQVAESALADGSVFSLWSRGAAYMSATIRTAAARRRRRSDGRATRAAAAGAACPVKFSPVADVASRPSHLVRATQFREEGSNLQPPGSEPGVLPVGR